MATVEDHYKDHLAPIYPWSAGGFDAAVARGNAEIESLLPVPPQGATGVDLGAGFGMHAIPLARRGYSVIAVDSSALLLDLLRLHAGALPIVSVMSDLSLFPQYLRDQVDVVVCMGDTLTHLPDMASVERLLSSVAASLRSGGKFITTFRDYTSPLVAEGRFIPVRSDADRILTCFLEFEPEHVEVHDVLHERDGNNWRLRVSSYQKLRLSPSWVSATLRANGFDVRVEEGMGGMVRMIAAAGS